MIDDKSTKHCFRCEPPVRLSGSSSARHTTRSMYLPRHQRRYAEKGIARITTGRVEGTMWCMHVCT